MKLTKAVFAEICAHALETYPHECCGVVVISAELGPRTQQVVRIRNIQEEMHARDPQRYPRTADIAYCGHPADLKRALELAETPGNELAAFYHSHPDHEAYFSDEDVAQATPFGEPSYPAALQIVVSVGRGAVRETKAFCWCEAERSFVETPLEIG